jgi:hypothetical protein
MSSEGFGEASTRTGPLDAAEADVKSRRKKKRAAIECASRCLPQTFLPLKKQATFQIQGCPSLINGPALERNGESRVGVAVRGRLHRRRHDGLAVDEQRKAVIAAEA